jgi:hypothetical protein
MSSGMLRRVALVRTDVSEDLSASLIRVTRIVELGTTLAVTSNRCTLRRNTNEALSSFETSVPIRATRRNIPEDIVLPAVRLCWLNTVGALWFQAQIQASFTATFMLQICTFHCDDNTSVAAQWLKQRINILLIHACALRIPVNMPTREV